MNEINEKFAEYMNKVKELDINGKRREVCDSIFDFAKKIDGFAKMDNIQIHYIQNEEINDLYKDEVSEDDFLEGIIVYIEILKNMVGEYILQKENKTN